MFVTKYYILQNIITFVTPKTMILANILKLYRERNRLTQEKVASYLGVVRELLSYYENSEREVPLDVLEKLANLYGADLADFFETSQEQVDINVNFAFRADDITDGDLEPLSEFRKAVKNYFKICEIERKYASRL